MELLAPIQNTSDWPKAAAERRLGESEQPQVIDDDPQHLARMLGRQNVSYEPIWEAVERAHPNWQPVLCNSMRRAILLASSATQHRSKVFEVSRKGRLVCIRLLRPDTQFQQTA
jgi:hypothetical protein